MFATTLASLKIGQSAIVNQIATSNSALKDRLLSLGLTEGRPIKVTKKALIGGTIAVELLGFTLALRLAEANAIKVIL